MFEALLFALNLSDSSLFLKPDIFTIIYEEITESNEPYGIGIICPKEIDLQKHLVLPLFAVWKTNNHDNINFLCPEKAYIVLTHLETNETLLMPMFESPEKMPLPEDENSEKNGLRKVKNPLSFTYRHDWFDVPIQSLILNAGNYSIVIICGKMVSNTHLISVGGASGETVIPMLQKRLETKFQSINKEQKVALLKTKHSPPIPQGTDHISICVISDILTEKQTECMLYGSYNLQCSNLLGGVPLELTIIIQDSDEGGAVEKKIIVPGLLATDNSNSVTGFFSLNLFELYFNNTTKTLSVPDTIIASVLYGAVMSDMLQLTKKID